MYSEYEKANLSLEGTEEIELVEACNRRLLEFFLGTPLLFDGHVLPILTGNLAHFQSVQP